MPTVNHTARSLLAHLRDSGEWCGGVRIEANNPSQALRELCATILAHAPAAWSPYGRDSERTDGYMQLPAPNGDHEATLTKYGLYSRTMIVHDLPRPPAWVAVDAASVERAAVLATVVGLLVGLASIKDDEQIMRERDAAHGDYLYDQAKDDRMEREWLERNHGGEG